MLKHVRLKITKKPCTCPNGPILTQEGHNMAETRLDTLERELNIKYNKEVDISCSGIENWESKVGRKMKGGLYV